VTATSSTYPQRELKDAKRFAHTIGIPHLIIHSKELDITKFSDNPPDRCYYCKKELFRKIQQIEKNIISTRSSTGRMPMMHLTTDLGQKHAKNSA
jgi:PP-loop superfamily ATP-utilizing enzyme